MSEWIVYSKDGLTERCSVKSLEYNGEWMGKCNVSVTISSPSPIEFEIGDFLEYRGERFEINYDPSVIKQASRDTYGDGFKYENVIFNSLSDELTRCDFLDYVPSDNQIHYTSLPTFSFFADNIGKLAERIQVNLDRIYKDDKKWTINVHLEYVNKTNVNITANNITCWDALALVKTEFDANFVIKGRTITIGTEGIAINKLFSYGKGNGLVSIERNAESEQKIITRLRAYGSTKNMPESYYKNLGMKVFFTIGEYSTFEQSVSFYIKTKYNSLNMFTTEWQEQSVGSYTPYKIKVRLNEVAVTAMVALNEGNIDSYINVSSTYEKDSTKLEQFMSDLRSNRYSKLYVESGVVQTAFPYEEREYLDNLPNNMAVRNLMLPSFPENQDPYIDSDNIEILGIREATVFFDGTNGLEEIYPTLPSKNGINQIKSAEQIADDGVFAEGSDIPTFEIYLNDIGFNINDYVSTAGNPIVAMKDGMCGGREFEVQSVESYGSGYKLTCNRSYDDTLDLYFPYNGYQIKSGDEFTLFNIYMPDEYVQDASERLLEAAKEYLSKNDYVRYSYIPKVDNVILARQHDEATANGERSIHDTIKEGDLMLFEDDDLRIDGSVIISTLSIKEGEGRIPQYEITLNNEKAVGSFDKIQNQIDSIVSGNTSIKGEGGYNSSQIKSLIKAYGDKSFLRKDKDDRSKGKISSDKGFEVGKFESGTLGTGASMYEGEDKNTYVEADFLKIRKKATFTTITVQELKHVGGEIILSPAAMICSRVEETDNGWKCYFNTEDSEGRKVYQEFAVDDFARCQTFNLSPKGANDLAGNHYYWRKVISVGDDYIELSKSECDAQSDIPQVGDNICQLGNKYNKERQNAIVLSAYGEDAPSYKQYKGINDFVLTNEMLVTKFSPKGNEITGILNIEKGSYGVGNLEDFPDEVFKAVHVGATNLLLNSGFTGDYQSESLNNPYELNEDTELYSKHLKNWSGIASIENDEVSVSGKSAIIGSLSQNVELINGESYVVSFKAKGSEIAVSCGSFGISQTLTAEYEKYTFKFVSDGSDIFIISGSAQVCDLQLERGTIATDWNPSPYDNDKALDGFKAIKYLSDAINNGSTDILGGLILSSMMQLGNYKDGKMERVNAGVSGIYNDDDDVAFWGGGTFEQAIKTVMKFKENPKYKPTNEEWADMANFVVSHGGDVFLRGYINALGGIFRGAVEIANGKILLDDDGSGHFANEAVRWTKEGIMFRKGSDNIVWKKIVDFYDTVYFDDGTFFDITTGLGAEYILSSPNYETLTIALKQNALSRNSDSATLIGRFIVYSHSDGLYKEEIYSYLKVGVRGKVFELIYDKIYNAWRYNGDDYSIINVEDDNGNVIKEIVSLGTIEDITSKGITSTITLEDKYLQTHTMKFENGILISHETVTL